MGFEEGGVGVGGMYWASVQQCRVSVTLMRPSIFPIKING